MQKKAGKIFSGHGRPLYFKPGCSRKDHSMRAAALFEKQFNAKILG